LRQFVKLIQLHDGSYATILDDPKQSAQSTMTSDSGTQAYLYEASFQAHIEALNLRDDPLMKAVKACSLIRFGERSAAYAHKDVLSSTKSVLLVHL
jgi:hypothetical protein